MSTASFSLSVQAPRIPSGLLFVIHSINVCCLWDLLFAVILCFLPHSYVFVLIFAIVPCQYILPHTHCWLSIVRAHVLRLRPSGGEIRSTKTCAAASPVLCVCV